MRWRFTILDRNGIKTIIDEPVGWDSNSCEITRDLNWHGVFFTSSSDALEYYGVAMRLLKAENDAYGAKGDMTLIIEEKCSLLTTGIITEDEAPILTEDGVPIITEDSQDSTNDGYVEFTRGKFVFIKYEYYCNDCYIKIPIESTGEVMNLKNLIDQPVNLEAVKAFDEITDLVPYDKLPFVIDLPSKGIFIQNNAEAISNSVEEFDGGFAQVFTEGDPIQIEFGLPDNQISEIGSFSVYPTHLADIILVPGDFFSNIPPTAIHGNGLWPLNLNPVLNYYEGSANYNAISNPVLFDILLSGIFEVKECYLGQTTIYLLRLPKSKVGELHVDYEFMAQYVLYNLTTADLAGMKPPNSGAIPFNFVFNANVVINAGDRFYLFMALNERKTTTEIDLVHAGAKAFKLTLDTTSHIRMTDLSHTPASIAKVYAINEIASRIAEAITNDKLRAYSEYFGRTDSKPYSLSADGCGSLEVVTDGLRIRRQENKIPGKPTLFTMSLKDFFDGINPIHNIGMGLEPDTNRAGYSRLRIEPWQYFYNNTVIMSCPGVNKLTRKTQDKEIYSTFQFGYSKWEAEEYTGLDEFLTKREYRTTINQVKNALIKLSNFISSGYALEVTRRKDDNTKDWRYDKNVFIICCKRVLGLINVELGNIESPENIIDPASIYNYRISPVRNAMRWMNMILKSYRKFDIDSKIIFMNGDGNYHAKGKMLSAACRLENLVLSENQMINKDIFANVLDAAPQLMPERIEYEYPMNSLDYKNIRDNPGGVIYFESDCEVGYGWIDTIIWKPETGLATFNLIPKYIS